MNTPDKINPSFPLKSSLMQSIVSKSNFRISGRNPMAENAEEMIIDAGKGVRLLGLYSPRKKSRNSGLFIMLHGWEGSSSSTYILSMGRLLYNAGYEIFRLNFRDHGDTQHLNEGLFNSTLLPETFNAVKEAAMLSKKPVYLIGFSLGGNFALRMAMRHSKEKINNLEHILAVSPVLDPDKATTAIDNNLFFRIYFRKKWSRALIKKQKAYPDKYDFTSILRKKTIREMTRIMAPLYTEYSDYKEYFKNYTIAPDALKNIKVPLTIITAEDDPVIPIEDFYRLEVNNGTRFIKLKYGGHCGFIERLPFDCWYEKRIFKILGINETNGQDY